MVATLVVPVHTRETGPTAMRPALQPKVHVSPFVMSEHMVHTLVKVRSSKSALLCA
jgi:hypothetical protein